MNRHDVAYGYNKITEAIGLVFAYLAEEGDKSLIPREIEKLLSDNKSIKYMKRSKEPARYRFMAYEILTDVLERSDLDAFVDEYNKTTVHQQRCWLLNYYFSIEDIEHHGNDFAKLVDFVDEHLPEDREEFLSFLEQPALLFDPLVEVIHAVASHPEMDSILTEEDQEVLRRKLASCESELSMRHPLSLAQSMMGKSFYNIGDWDNYEFYYVKSLYPYMLRVSNHRSNIMLMALHRSNELNKDWEESLQQRMKIIAVPKRMEILRMIYANPMFGKEIAEALSLTTATVSHHIDVLRNEGFINVERDKNTKYFSTNTLAFQRVMKDLEKYIMKSN